MLSEKELLTMVDQADSTLKGGDSKGLFASFKKLGWKNANDMKSDLAAASKLSKKVTEAGGPNSTQPDGPPETPKNSIWDSISGMWGDFKDWVISTTNSAFDMGKNCAEDLGDWGNEKVDALGGISKGSLVIIGVVSSLILIGAYKIIKKVKGAKSESTKSDVLVNVKGFTTTLNESSKFSRDLKDIAIFESQIKESSSPNQIKGIMKKGIEPCRAAIAFVKNGESSSKVGTVIKHMIFPVLCLCIGAFVITLDFFHKDNGGYFQNAGREYGKFWDDIAQK